MNVLALLTDAFGSTGGIAKFNRDLLGAVCSHPAIERVTTVTRLPGVGPTPAALGECIAPRTRSRLEFLAVVARAVFRARPSDLIICGHLDLLPVAVAVKSALGGRILLVIHGTEAWRPRRGVARRCVSHVDAVASVSDFTRLRFQRWSDVACPVMLLPNAVDLRLFTPGPKPPALMARYGVGGKRVVMTLARLDAAERGKGIDEVLEAVRAIVASTPDVVYLVAGDGTDRVRLERRAEELGIRDHVIFPGLIAEGEKADHFRLADVFVMPSRQEGFGIVFLEAMACGLPVIGSAVDGSREALLDGRLGLVVDPGDPRQLEAALQESLRKKDRTVSPELSTFSDESFVRRCHAILDALAVRAPRQGAS